MWLTTIRSAILWTIRVDSIRQTVTFGAFTGCFIICSPRREALLFLNSIFPYLWSLEWKFSVIPITYVLFGMIHRFSGLRNHIVPFASTFSSLASWFRFRRSWSVYCSTLSCFRASLRAFLFSVSIGNIIFSFWLLFLCSTFLLAVYVDHRRTMGLILLSLLSFVE